jgi:hypothetical protein
MPKHHVTMVGSKLRCWHCGDSYVLFTPCEIPVLIATARAYAETHAACVPSEPKAGRFKFDSPQDWLERGDTCAASRVIWDTMVFPVPGPGGVAVPRDPSAFGRCYLLLLAFPSWRNRLTDVAECHRVWWPYVDRWDELSALYELGLPARDFTALKKLLEQLWVRAA